MDRMGNLSSTAVALGVALLVTLATEVDAQGAVGTGARSPRPRADSTAALVTRARAIHDRVITLDTHVDIPNDWATARSDPGTRGTSQVDLVKMKEGGLDVAFFIVYVGQPLVRNDSTRRLARDAAFNKFVAIHRMAEQMYPDRVAIPYRADDVERIARSGKLVAAIGIENGFSVGTDLTLVKLFHDLGGRYIGITHNNHSDLGDSNVHGGDPNNREHNGLSELGRRFVGEVNRVGLMLDVSHAGKQTMLEAVRLSRAPVIASHSSTTAYANHPRNLDDEQLLALKQNGGVMQTVAFANYVRIAPPERQQAIAALSQEFGLPVGGGGGRGGRGRGATDTTAVGAGAAAAGVAGGGGRAGGRGGRGRGRGGDAALDSLAPARRAEYDRRLAEIDARWPAGRATVADFVNHIDHAVQVMGIDHVGISSDFDGGGGVAGWNDASETFNVTFELVRRGYTEPEIAKLWSGNLVRVWREVERVAARMQAVQGR
jgi:membrane dipeptidase